MDLKQDFNLKVWNNVVQYKFQTICSVFFSLIKFTRYSIHLYRHEVINYSYCKTITLAKKQIKYITLNSLEAAL